jgi:hypothetical protein
MQRKKSPSATAAAPGPRPNKSTKFPTNKRTIAATQAPRSDRPVYLLRLQSLRGDDIRKLRWLLKTLSRRFGLRALSVEEERP